MAKGNKRQRHNGPPRPGRRNPAEPRALVSLAPREKKPPVRYGVAFVLLEDGQKNTFHFQAGAWVAHERSIADYRADSQVKALPQQVNGMARYEIRCPLLR